MTRTRSRLVRASAIVTMVMSFLGLVYLAMALWSPAPAPVVETLGLALPNAISSSSWTKHG
ncbi:MAG TPA: hypothetical protein PK042_00800 [Usitatibacteraceae bacterium]|nr:hypothetical protein [Usitatibacteraceae bacterium]